MEIPTSAFVQNADTICITDVLDLDYTGTPNANTYNWSFEDGTGSGLLTDQMVVFNSPGLKTISLQVIKDGCISEVTSSSVLVEPELDPVTVQCDTAGTDFITFSWNAIDGVTLYEVTVDNNPTIFSPNTSITIDGLDELQTVTIEVASLSNTSCPGSSATSSCTTQMSVSTETPLALAGISIYPNPVQDVLFFEGIETRRVAYQLYTVTGEKVKQGDILSDNIDISTLKHGIYILRISEKQNGTFKDFKVVKE